MREEIMLGGPWEGGGGFEGGEDIVRVCVVVVEVEVVRGGLPGCW